MNESIGASIGGTVQRMKTSKRIRIAILSPLLAGSVVLLTPAAGAQQYVPAQNATVEPTVVVLSEVLVEPAVKQPPKAGILPRTGEEAMPLVRNGLAAVAFGAGLWMLARRRREGLAAA